MKKYNVLIVDDQPELRKLIRMTLEQGDYQLEEAENGSQALLMTKTLAPDLIILDVMMPGDKNGYQVCEEIKKNTQGKSPYIILLTARGQKSDLEEGAKAGADSYLIKPFSPLELIDTVNKVLA